MYSYVYSSIHSSIHIYIHPRFLLPLLREETRHRAKRSIVDAFPPFFRVETVSNPFPRIWHHFVFRRTSIVRIQCFTMCFVPVGIMKRVDAASSRRVVLSSRCSKERLKRRFRKVGSGFEVRDTGWWCLVSVNGNFSSERNFLIANEIRAVFRLVLYPSLSNRIVDNDPVRRSRKEKTDDTRSLPSRTCT